ncbi:hypothetical protein ACIQ2D_04055 [Lysinibacillus sp. NPDC097287]|uniref:hypothetical protein n=1 Tax=Lysinibacillus sp. NPDC097287 TaxID=3364144 RepID=UPI0037F3F011
MSQLQGNTMLVTKACAAVASLSRTQDVTFLVFVPLKASKANAVSYTRPAGTKINKHSKINSFFKQMSPLTFDDE